MPGKGREPTGPIRDANPCLNCLERFTACADHCPKDERGEYGRKAWVAEVKRVNKNRRDYMRKVGIRVKKWEVADD